MNSNYLKLEKKGTQLTQILLWRIISALKKPAQVTSAGPRKSLSVMLVGRTKPGSEKL